MKIPSDVYTLNGVMNMKNELSEFKCNNSSLSHLGLSGVNFRWEPRVTS